MKTIFNPGTKKKTLTLVDNVVYSTVKDLNGDPLELKLSVLLQNGNSEMRAAMGEDDPRRITVRSRHWSGYLAAVGKAQTRI